MEKERAVSLGEQGFITENSVDMLQNGCYSLCQRKRRKRERRKKEKKERERRKKERKKEREKETGKKKSFTD